MQVGGYCWYPQTHPVGGLVGTCGPHLPGPGPSLVPGPQGPARFRASLSPADFEVGFRSPHLYFCDIMCHKSRSTSYLHYYIRGLMTLIF
jgi:hypothetical protein